MFLTDIMLHASEGDPKIPKEQNNAKKKKKICSVCTRVRNEPGLGAKLLIKVTKMP